MSHLWRFVAVRSWGANVTSPVAFREQRGVSNTSMDILCVPFERAEALSRIDVPDAKRLVQTYRDGRAFRLDESQFVKRRCQVFPRPALRLVIRQFGKRPRIATAPRVRLSRVELAMEIAGQSSMQLATSLTCAGSCNGS